MLVGSRCVRGRIAYVAPVSYSLAQAYADPEVAWPRLVCDEGRVAAFVMAGFKDGDPAVIAVGLKAFAGTSGTPTPPPLSSEQFAQLSEHACISLRRELKPVTDRSSSTAKGAARSVHQTASVLAGLNLELDGQIPPPAEVARFRHLLAGIQSAAATCSNWIG